MTMPAAAQSRSLPELARHVVGRPINLLSTPALLLDIDLAKGNIDAMARWARTAQVSLRPHIKVHKCTELAWLQVAAGAVGVSVATVWEALAMARAGLADVFIVNEVVGAGKLPVVMEAATHASISVAVDDESQVTALSAAAARAGVDIGVVIDVDTGMGRCGVRDVAAALAVARAVAASRGLQLNGVSGYEGHCTLEPIRARRTTMVHIAMNRLVEAADALIQDGHPCSVVSAGGTGTYELTAVNPRVTEIQAGSYVVMDSFHKDLTAEFELALTVLTTVISRHGDRAILDGGRKAVGSDHRPPRPRGLDAEMQFVDEEHTGIALLNETELAIGEPVELIPGYAPTAVNLYDVIHVVSKGRVVDLWPIQARYGRATLG
jgi:D-serine deaminase-like pyridoxal phosphate-dependent protein